MVEKFGIGQPVRRKEDVRLLTGRGTYTDDIDRPGQAHAFVLRSPHAHARILSIDTAAARAAPGVLAVLTGRDAEADGIGHFPVMVEVPGRDGGKLWPTPREILQTAKVRFVGDPVALVVAETRQEAQDAAELVEVEYDLLPSVTDTAAADRAGRAAGLGGARQQPLRPLEQRARGGGRRGLRARRARGAGGAGEQPAGRQPDGAARRHRRVRPGDGRLHAPFADPGRDPGAGRAVASTC